MEAAVGVAAINSFFNAPETLAGRGVRRNALEAARTFLTAPCRRSRDEKWPSLATSPILSPWLAQCRLHILERRPQGGDFPDPACEYLLPSMDYVFITGSTFINKTLPAGLLALSCGAKTVVVGPSTPLSPLLFDHGASLLAGTVVRDAASVWSHVAEGGDRSIFQHGAEMMKITATETKVSSQSPEIVGQGATMADSKTQPILKDNTSRHIVCNPPHHFILHETKVPIFRKERTCAKPICSGGAICAADVGRL